MKRLLYIAGMLLASGGFYAASASAEQPFAGCKEKDCTTINDCSIACSNCAGAGHDRVCEWPI